MTSEIVVQSDMSLDGSNPLAQKISELDEAINDVARQAITEVVDTDEYTQLEIDAMIAGKKLELTNALELAAILFRGRYVQEIEDDNLVQMHPNQYISLAQMAEDNGISTAELSKTINLVRIIFPALITLGYDIAEVWGKIGKSKMGELVPVLRELITNEPSDSARVHQAVENILNGVAAVAASAGEEMTDEEIRHEAIRSLVEDGQQLSFRQLRDVLDTTPVPAINISVLPVDDARIVMAVVTHDQYVMLNQKMGGKIESNIFELPEESVARTREASAIPEVREILDFIGGVV